MRFLWLSYRAYCCDSNEPKIIEIGFLLQNLLPFLCTLSGSTSSLPNNIGGPVVGPTTWYWYRHKHTGVIFGGRDHLGSCITVIYSGVPYYTFWDATVGFWGTYLREPYFPMVSKPFASFLLHFLPSQAL
jgi:hypothetical protein